MQYNKLGDPILRMLGKDPSYKTLLETAYHIGVELKMKNSNTVLIEEWVGKIFRQNLCRLEELPEILNMIMEYRNLIKEEEPKEF